MPTLPADSYTRGIVRGLISLLFIFGGISSYASIEASFLEPEEAFQPVLSIDNNTLVVQWDIAQGYYLYRHGFNMEVQDTHDYSPVVFKVLEQGKKKFDDNFGKEVETFYHTVTMHADVSAYTGKKFDVILGAQGCAEEGLCYPPTDYEFSVDADTVISKKSNDDSIFEPSAVESTSITPVTMNAITKEFSATPNSSVASSTISFSTMIFTVFAAILGGLILNLMPCVFPVLSLKALSFADIHESKATLHLHGWAYTVGVILAFLTAASVILLARSAGESLGWGFQLQHPVFVSIMIYLFFVMGLSLSGAFEFGGAFMGVGQNLTTGHSLKSSFFTGVLAALVASPCTAPFMATALGVALTQPIAYALLIFIALGFGMALPFLLLSYAPVLHRWLPAPGNWMVTFKQFLAFPMYLTVIWLLWVLAHQTSADTVIKILVGMLMIVVGLWLSRFRSSSLLAQTFRRASITAMFIPAIMLAVFSNGANKEKSPPQHANAAHYETYSHQRLKEYRAQGTPVFVDLTADWCITCKVNERVAFTSHIKNEFSTNKIAVLVGDWTNRNPEIARLLKAQNRSGIPLYLMYPKGTGEPEVLPQILTEGIIEGAISRAIN